MSSRESGFTVLEAMVALAIVSLVGIGALGAWGTELRTAERTRRHLEAMALAEDRLNRLRLVSAEDLAVLPDSLRAGDFGAPFDAYRWSARAEPLAGDAAVFHLAVRVDWESGSRDLATRVYRPPRRRP